MLSYKVVRILGTDMIVRGACDWFIVTGYLGYLKLQYFEETPLFIKQIEKNKGSARRAKKGLNDYIKTMDRKIRTTWRQEIGTVSLEGRDFALVSDQELNKAFASVEDLWRAVRINLESNFETRVGRSEYRLPVKKNEILEAISIYFATGFESLKFATDFLSPRVGR